MHWRGFVYKYSNSWKSEKRNHSRDKKILRNLHINLLFLWKISKQECSINIHLFISEVDCDHNPVAWKLIDQKKSTTLWTKCLLPTMEVKDFLFPQSLLITWIGIKVFSSISEGNDSSLPLPQWKIFIVADLLKSNLVLHELKALLIELSINITSKLMERPQRKISHELLQAYSKTSLKESDKDLSQFVSVSWHLINLKTFYRMHNLVCY